MKPDGMDPMSLRSVSGSAISSYCCCQQDNTKENQFLMIMHKARGIIMTFCYFCIYHMILHPVSKKGYTFEGDLQGIMNGEGVLHCSFTLYSRTNMFLSKMVLGYFSAC